MDLQFVGAGATGVGSSANTHAPSMFATGLNGTPGRVPNFEFPRHKGNFQTATCAYRAKIPSKDFICSPKLKGGGEWVAKV